MKNKRSNFIERATNRLYAKYMVPFREKVFCASNGIKVHYLFFPRKASRVLAVGFQAFHPSGEARYNYLSTLSGLPVNRLYIKDDFLPGGASFYLGTDGTSAVEDAVLELIQQYVDKTNPVRTVFFGSCKGGYAAFNYGLRFPNSSIVAAAPPYYLGTHLSGIQKFQNTLRFIFNGNITDKKIAILDKKITSLIMNNPNRDTINVYFQYSIHDGFYIKHDQYMIRDLRAEGIQVETDEREYKHHDDIRLYFPPYLRQAIQTIANIYNYM